MAADPGGAAHRGLQVTALLRLSVGNQFGMHPEEIKSILREAHPAVRVTGIQLFSGTQKKTGGRIRRELDKAGPLPGRVGGRVRLASRGAGIRRRTPRPIF